MAMNWKNYERAKASGGGARNGNRFIIKDGESVMVRFLVNDNEPYVYKEHYANQARRYLICAEDAVASGKHSGCVPCYLARMDRKKFKNATRRFAFSLIDSRKFHVLEKEGKRVYQPCTDDDTCKYCRKGNEAKSSGVRFWNVNQTVADQIRAFERESLGRTCQCGGRIKVKEYICPECDSELEPDDPSESMRCFTCEKEHGKKKPFMVMPEEVLSCKKCDKPRRLSLSDAWITITRAGEGTNTAYNFATAEVGSIDKEYAECKPVNFESHPDFQPISSAEQAAILNVRNPFGGGAQDVPRPDDDDDEDDDSDDDDELEFKKSKDSYRRY